MRQRFIHFNTIAKNKIIGRPALVNPDGGMTCTPFVGTGVRRLMTMTRPGDLESLPNTLTTHTTKE